MKIAKKILNQIKNLLAWLISPPRSPVLQHDSYTEKMLNEAYRLRQILQ